MKLIDLLVQELPKRGGWPDGAEYCHLTQYDRHCLTIVFSHSQVGTGNNPIISKEEMVFSGIGYLGDTLYDCTVTAGQYESALAASQKPAWNGEGLPPAGCECELKYKCHNDDAYWERVVILWQRGDDTLVEYVGDHFKNTTQLIHKTSMHVDLRPLRTESERKHEAVLESICAVLEMVAQDYKRNDEAKLIYEAIAAGKIPGVKLDD